MTGKSATFTSKSAIKKAIKKGLITINNLPTTTATFVQGGQSISIQQDNKQTTRRQLIYPLSVLFEDDYLAVINKPPGILVSGNTFKTIDNALVQNLKRSSLLDACRPRPVHRLDYPTTGLLLIGKTSSAIICLNQLFELKTIQKTYLAITFGKMKPHGLIQEPIDEKYAETNFKVLSTVKSKRFSCLNLLLLQPKTGRRHQLRKHLALIGNEILGEKEYGRTEFSLKGKGLYLHAFSLEFIHPQSGNHLRVQSEIPERFQKIFEDFKLDANSSSSA